MQDSKKPDVNRPTVLAVAIRNKASLYACYMPFVKGGGLFIPTNGSFNLGDVVVMLLTFLDEPIKIPISGNVVWLNPSNAIGNRPQGVGIQLDDSESAKTLRAKIEGLLAGTAQSSRPTNTI